MLFMKNTDQRGTGIENGSEWLNGPVHFRAIGLLGRDPFNQNFRNFRSKTE